MRRFLAYWAAACLLAFIVTPALYAQISNTTPAVVTLWSVEAATNGTGTIVKSYPLTPAEVRATANRYCTEYPAELAAICLTKVRAASFQSLTAGGPNKAWWEIDMERNVAGGLREYLVITAQKAP